MLVELPPPLASARPPLPRPEIAVPRRIGGADVRGTREMRGYRGRIAIDVGGGWSRRFPKRSYNLELQDPDGFNRNASLLGMPADDDWVLYASYDDRTLIRNVLAYDTARWMGRYAARTRYVRLRINGRYRGVYVLMEKLKVLDSRVRAGDGLLLELTSRRQARWKDPSFPTPVTRVPVVWADPERDDLFRNPAALRDSARWPADGVHRPRGRRSVHVTNLRKWLGRRIAWLDRNLREEAP